MFESVPHTKVLLSSLPLRCCLLSERIRYDNIINIKQSLLAGSKGGITKTRGIWKDERREARVKVYMWTLPGINNSSMQTGPVLRCGTLMSLSQE